MTNLNVEQIIEKVKAAGLHEFGVYNEPLADKWQTIAAKADETDGPMIVGAGINNCDTKGVCLSILKEAPEQVIEGLLAAGKVVGTEELTLYVPAAEEQLKQSLEESCKQAGIILESGFVNGRKFRGKTVHHIETLKALAEVLADSYEPGVVVAVEKDGTVGAPKKVAFGTKVMDLIGGSDNVKGVMIGTKLYDAQTATDMTIEVTTPISDGVIKVFTNNQCMIDQAEKQLLMERENGCGKCTFCREGLGQLHAMTKDMTMGQAKGTYLDLMEEIGQAMTFSTMCSVGATGADFTLDSMKYFADEYNDHIKKKKCSVNVCNAFMNIYIDPNTCTGCEECADVCPADAIEGKSGFIHMIDEFECTKCGKCIEACEEEAIIQTTGRVPKLPTRLVKVGKFKKR